MSRPDVVRTAEVVAVGDELLSGARVNSNAAWLGARLGEVGVRVVHGTVVGDDPVLVVAALRTAAARCDLVVVTGGLGPTSDDRTRDALASLLGVVLEQDVETAERITAWHAARDRTPSADVLRQADVPAGARTLRNDAGTAPGLLVRVGDATLVALPGVPAEMRAIMTGSVLPGLREQGGGPVVVETLRTVLTSESVVARAIADVEGRAAAAGVAVAYLPSVAEVVVRLVGGAGSDPAQVRTLADDAATALGDLVAVRGDTSLARAVIDLLRSSGSTVAVAESLTGGLVDAALTDVPGASDVLLGGVVAYAADAKSALLGVDAALLREVGTVHPDVALAMAAGVRDRLGSTYGVATTGVAGPGPHEGRQPGEIHVAVVGPDAALVVSPRLGGDRDRVRRATVVHALELVRRAALGLPAPG